jgi:DNA polymerase III sliding clamp (beta) subunit (PCNA family)
MTTVQENKTVTDTIEVMGESLIQLLEGAITHSTKDKSLHALYSVQIAGQGKLSARATDRYRLIEGEVEAEGSLSPSLIGLDDTKRVITLIKANKYSRVTLNRIGDLLTVSVTGSSITVQLLDANYPPSFDDLLNKSERDNLAEISFNPAFMADYAKVAGKNNAVRVEFMGKGKPMIVHLPETKVKWRALLMPMRYVD